MFFSIPCTVTCIIASVGKNHLLSEADTKRYEIVGDIYCSFNERMNIIAF